MSGPLNEEEEFEFLYQMEKNAKRGIPPANPAPVKASMGDVIAGTPVARFAMGATAPLIGAAQLGAHVGDIANRAMGVEPVVSPWIDKQLAELEAAKQRGMKASGAKGMDVWGALGQIAPTAKIAAGVQQALPTAQGLLGRMGIGAAQGGAVAATTPVTETKRGFWPQKGEQTGAGTAIGGVIPAIGEGVQGLYNAGKKAVEPIYESGRKAILQRFQQGLLGNDPARIAAATQAAQQAKMIVPGSLPTTGEALSDVPGATGILAHQQNIAKLPTISPQFAERAAQQEGARAGALAPIAQTPAALEAAVRARGVEAKQLYGAAAHQTVQPDAAFAALMDRPSMMKAAARASELAKEAGETFDPTSVKSLHYMKMAMDDLLKNPERFSIGATEAGAIGKTQKDFVKWLETNAPDYGTARQAFKGKSVDINRMQVGQELEKALTTPLGTSERAGVFAKAVEEAPRTIKRATGQQMFDKLEDVLQPQESQAVRQVAAELARQDAMKRGARMTSLSGADAIPGKVGLPLPNLLSRPAMIANFVMGKLGQSAEEKIAQEAAKQYLNPAQFVEGQANVPARYQPMIEALMRQASPQAAGMAARGY